jgi:hypothetical protein
MEIPIGGEVSCSDGPAGEVTHVIVDVQSRRVTGVVVKEGEAPHVERVVPLWRIGRADAQGIWLDGARRELAAMKELQRPGAIEAHTWWHGMGPAEFEPVERQNIAESEVALGRSTPVKATDGEAGHIARVIVDRASGTTQRLVLEVGPARAAKGVSVLRTEIDYMTDRAVYLTIDRKAIQELWKRAR